MAIVFTPETAFKNREPFPSVFLAGTIEMGKSVDWQADVIERLKDENVTLFNPRRVIAPELEDEIDFQINWELDRLQEADIIFMFLASGTISPISLLELGIYLNSGKPLIAVCEPGYTRRQNVHVTMKRFYNVANIHLTDNLDEGMNILHNYINVTSCLQELEHMIKYPE